MPLAGYYNGTNLNNAGNNGYYWSSTPYGNNAYYLNTNGNNANVNNNNRNYGYSVRPVLAQHLPDYSLHGV